MGIRRHKVMYDSSAAGNGDWFRLDSRYEESSDRVIHVELTSNDTITIQGTTVDVRGGNPATVTANLEADDIVDITTLSADGTYLLQGPWSYIRAVKTGTTANAKVQGFI